MVRRLSVRLGPQLRLATQPDKENQHKDKDHRIAGEVPRRVRKKLLQRPGVPLHRLENLTPEIAFPGGAEGLPQRRTVEPKEVFLTVLDLGLDLFSQCPQPTPLLGNLGLEGEQLGATVHNGLLRVFDFRHGLAQLVHEGHGQFLGVRVLKRQFPQVLEAPEFRQVFVEIDGTGVEQVEPNGESALDPDKIRVGVLERLGGTIRFQHGPDLGVERGDRFLDPRQLLNDLADLVSRLNVGLEPSQQPCDLADRCRDPARRDRCRGRSRCRRELLISLSQHRRSSE